MFDFHMHSTVSFDGQDSPERMVQAAVDQGLKEICFTDHIDDDPMGLVTNQRFTAEDYARAYDSLSAPGLKIRRGMEYGLLADNQHLLQACAEMRDFDYIIGSIHYADGLDIYLQPYWEGKTVWEAEHRCLVNTLECVRNHDNFDVLGHLTYVSKARANPVHRPVPYEEHREVVDEILKTLAEKGKGMELNTSGMDRCGDWLPPLIYLKRFQELGGQIVTIGSDAHTWDRVGQYTREACKLIGQVFGYVCTFEGRKPIFHKL